MPGERRQHFRVVPEDGYPIKIDINGDNFLENMEAVDISEGGLGVLVQNRFKDCRIDKTVTVVVTLPSPLHYQFAVQASIRHVYGDRFGIEFVDLKETAGFKVKAYIAHRLRNQSWFVRLKYKLGIG